MENLLLEYYGIKTKKVYKNDGKYIFNYNNNLYEIDKVYNVKNILLIENLINYYEYDRIIKNKYGNIITKINDDNYIVLEKKHLKYNLINEIINNIKRPINYYNVDKINWIKLWKEKIDYYEYILKYKKEYTTISESSNYYIGMSETAISYIKYNLIPEQEESLVISHKRIDDRDYYNPVNIIIDNRARDIAEFIKYVYFNDKKEYRNIDSIIEKLDFSRNEYILLYGRLLFPNYFFDTCDKIINKQDGEEKLQLILEKTQQYEMFLDKIYNKINKKIKIPKINWI